MSCSLGVLLVAAVGLARHPNGCRGGPPVAPPTPFHPPGNWAGVKRSRKQATGLAATKAEVRPALDADPAEHEHRPIMVVEGMGLPQQRQPGVVHQRYLRAPIPSYSPLLLQQQAQIDDMSRAAPTTASHMECLEMPASRQFSGVRSYG